MTSTVIRIKQKCPRRSILSRPSVVHHISLMSFGVGSIELRNLYGQYCYSLSQRNLHPPIKMTQDPVDKTHRIAHKIIHRRSWGNSQQDTEHFPSSSSSTDLAVNRSLQNVIFSLLRFLCCSCIDCTAIISSVINQIGLGQIRTTGEETPQVAITVSAAWQSKWD